MKISIINKIFLSIELILIMLLLILSTFLLLGASQPAYLLIILLSIASMISLIHLISKTISGKANEVNQWFIISAHIGLLITVMGVLVLLIDGNSFRNHSPNPPYSIFSFGLVAVIPYLHVMILNRFFVNRTFKNINVSS